jgi:spermidine synthase
VVARVYYNWGRGHHGRGNLDEAIRNYRLALETKPTFADARTDLGVALLGKGVLEDAISQSRRALEDNPDPARAHYTLGLAFSTLHRAVEARAELRAAARLKPYWHSPLNNLAWDLATHPDPVLRDGPEAVRLAERAATLTAHEDAGVLDTLAAAYAAAGQFDRAVRTVEAALALSPDAGFRERLRLYRQGQAYHQSPR